MHEYRFDPYAYWLSWIFAYHYQPKAAAIIEWHMAYYKAEERKKAQPPALKVVRAPDDAAELKVA